MVSTAQTDLSRSEDGEFLARLRQLIDEHGGPKAVAARSGVNLRTLHYYLSGASEPKLAAMIAVSDACGVSLQWLAKGEGDKNVTSPASTAARSFPVIGLASCGLRNWFSGDQMSVDAELRLDDPDAFAVMAVGDSLQPDGVRQGFLCFCSPNYSRKPGDIVFAERSDGTAALKRLVSESPEKIVMEGWLPPEDGEHVAYREEVKASYIRRLATVVYVKRKL